MISGHMNNKLNKHFTCRVQNINSTSKRLFNLQEHFPCHIFHLHITRKGEASYMYVKKVTRESERRSEMKCKMHDT